MSQEQVSRGGIQFLSAIRQIRETDYLGSIREKLVGGGGKRGEMESVKREFPWSNYLQGGPNSHLNLGAQSSQRPEEEGVGQVREPK